MSSKKKRNDVGSGPGENIDIEDKINAAMDKIMKDPEEERNSSQRKYEPDNGESETEEYESEERYGLEEEYESEERYGSEEEYESDEAYDSEEEYESEEAYDSEDEYESEEDYDPEEEYGSQEEHDEDTEYAPGEYDEEGYDEPEEENILSSYRNVNTSGNAKSARPQPVKYVPMDDIEEKLALLPENKRKKHKGLKITGLAAAMAVVVAGCAYAGMTYYYSDRFF